MSSKTIDGSNNTPDFNQTISISPPNGLTTNGVDIFTYSVGTWTPILDGTITYTVQTGNWSQMGREVKASFNITFSVTIAGATNLRILNLPFQAAPNSRAVALTKTTGLSGQSANTPWTAEGIPGSRIVEFFDNDEVQVILKSTWVNISLRGLLIYFIS